MPSDGRGNIVTNILRFGMIIGLLFAAVLAPTAAAGTNECHSAAAVNACVYDAVYQDGCFVFALTYIDVWTPATDVYFNGYNGDFCGTRLHGMAVGGSVGPLHAGFVWYDVSSGSSSSCNMYVYYLTPPTGSQSVPLGCPVGNQPRADWGNMLP